MQLFANNADSSLNGAIAPDTLALTLKAGEGSKFPSPSNGDYFLVTLFQRVGTTELNHEIVKCTSRVGDNLTVVRAQEGTTAKAFNSGDLVELRFTKGTAENFSQPADLATKEPVITAPGSAPTEKYWRGDKTWSDFFTDVRAATLTGLSTATNAVVAAADTVLAAIGKLQAQVSAKFDKTGGVISGGISVAGNVLATSGALGYGVGAGGTVVQATSKSNAVTLNKVCGQITMHNAALAANEAVRFTVNNTFVDPTDEVSVWIVNPVNASAYDVAVDGIVPGVFVIRLRNNTSTSYSDSVVLGFAVRKVATS